MKEPEIQAEACRSLRWALALLEGLIRGGMQRLVLSPGSRSTPLVLAAQQRPELTLTPVLDERSAAFYALGLARASGRPVGLVCTSGSALGHWFPAVMEASESDLPLILLSADRPPELRGWGANQTLDQTRLFGPFVREFHDPGPAEDGPAGFKMMRALGLRAATVSLGRRPGPVHLNLPFREPLVPAPGCLAAGSARETDTARIAVGETSAAGAGAGGRGAPASVLDRGFATGQGSRPWLISGPPPPELDAMLVGRGLICCGPSEWRPESVTHLWACAERLAVPVLCDPLSGLRFGPAVGPRISRYDSLLRNDRAAAALRPDWVLRFGRAPVSKTLLGWLEGVPTILVAPGRGWSDPNHDVRLRVDADPAGFCAWLRSSEWAPAEQAVADPDWLEGWIAAERRLDRLAAEYLDQAPWCEAHLLGELLTALPADEGLLCANSLPIRQLDTWSGTRATGLRVFGNRGVSGIDGQSSTLAGLNAGGVPTTGLLGDLSFLHDLSGLFLIQRLDRPCVVLNNGGGRIFDYLPQRGLPGLERFWRTPLAIDLGALVGPFGIDHREVSDGAGFREALDEALGRGGVIEVRLDAEVSRAVHQGFWQAIREEPVGFEG